MITVNENTTFVGVSELRTHMDEILIASRKNKVIIEKRHKPYAVILDAKKFEQMEHQLEAMEDFLLGILAKEREREGKSSDYIDIETAFKMVKEK
jgi:prevent-host-death family protein